MFTTLFWLLESAGAADVALQAIDDSFPLTRKLGGIAGGAQVVRPSSRAPLVIPALTMLHLDLSFLARYLGRDEGTSDALSIAKVVLW